MIPMKSRIVSIREKSDSESERRKEECVIEKSGIDESPSEPRTRVKLFGGRGNQNCWEKKEEREGRSNPHRLNRIVKVHFLNCPRIIHREKDYWRKKRVSNSERDTMQGVRVKGRYDGSIDCLDDRYYENFILQTSYRREDLQNYKKDGIVPLVAVLPSMTQLFQPFFQAREEGDRKIPLEDWEVFHSIPRCPRCKAFSLNMQGVVCVMCRCRWEDSVLYMFESVRL